MKKILIILLLLFITLTSSFAYEENFHLGYFSGYGLSKEKDDYQYGFDIVSPFPCYGIASGILGTIYNDLPFWDGFVIGSKQYIGLDLYAYKTLAEKDKFSTLFGCNIFTTYENANTALRTLIKPSFKVSYDIKNDVSLYLVAGLSLFDITYIKGFKNPLIIIPMINFETFMRGSKIGFSIKK